MHDTLYEQDEFFLGPVPISETNFEKPVLGSEIIDAWLEDKPDNVSHNHEVVVNEIINIAKYRFCLHLDRFAADALVSSYEREEREPFPIEYLFKQPLEEFEFYHEDCSA